MAVLIAAPLGGCFLWRLQARPPVAPSGGSSGVAPGPLPSSAFDDAQPASAARAACPNYGKTFNDAEYPRDAILRGLERGDAEVWFLVDGTALTVLSVKASDPAFANAAVEIVGKLQCRVDRPTRFVVPLRWGSKR